MREQPVDLVGFERAEETQVRYGREVRNRLAQQAGLSDALQAYYEQQGYVDDLEDTPQAVHDWRDKAVCLETDPEIFFPEKGGSTREAKKLCQSCEVCTDCLEFALEHEERFGIWGGLSERERRKLVKVRRAEAKKAASADAA